MKRNFVLGIVAGLAVAGLGLAGCDSGGGTPDAVGIDTTGADTGTDTTPQPDTTTTGDAVVPTDEGPGPDMPKGEAQLNYVITSLNILTPGADQNTGFATLMNTVLPLAFQGALSDSPLYLVVTFSTVAPGSTIVRVCQGDENADGTLSCAADPAPVETTGTIDNSGNLTTDPTDFTFAVRDTPAGDIAVTLANFTMTGLLEATADLGTQAAPRASTGQLLDGEFSAQLPADDLCAVTLSNDILGGFCNGITTINLLDLLDGPADQCGQDGSADFTPGVCTASTDKAAHNPPVDVGGGDFRFDTAGTVDLEGVLFTK